jgi:plastocyanin
MKLLRISLLLSASALLIGAVAACSDDDDDEAEPAATTAPADGGGGGDSVIVEGKDFSFDPSTFTVAAGKEVTVTLNNTGNPPHTLTVYTDEDYKDPVDGADTENVDGGDSGEFTATFEGGEYYFRCEIHPAQMTGEFEAE